LFRQVFINFWREWLDRFDLNSTTLQPCFHAE